MSGKRALSFFGMSFSYFLFKEFITEWQAQKSTQRKPRHPKLGAEGIASNEVLFVHYALQKLMTLIRARKIKIGSDTEVLQEGNCVRAESTQGL